MHSGCRKFSQPEFEISFQSGLHTNNVLLVKFFTTLSKTLRARKLLAATSKWELNRESILNIQRPIKYLYVFLVTVKLT